MNYVHPKHPESIQEQLQQIYAAQQDVYDHAYSLLSPTDLPNEMEMKALGRLMERSSQLQSQLPTLLRTWESMGKPTSLNLQYAVERVRQSIDRLLRQIAILEQRTTVSRDAVLPNLARTHQIRRILAAYSNTK